MKRSFRLVLITLALISGLGISAFSGFWFADRSWRQAVADRSLNDMTLVLGAKAFEAKGDVTNADLTLGLLLRQQVVSAWNYDSNDDSRHLEYKREAFGRAEPIVRKTMTETIPGNEQFSPTLNKAFAWANRAGK